MTAGSGYPAYNAVMDEIANEEANVFVVDSIGAGLRDGNHWSYAGLKTVTARMVSITKNKLGLIYPGTPTSLIATPTATQAQLSWTAPVSNGGSSITDYSVEYKPSVDSTWNTFADGVSATTGATVTGLSGGTAYDFRVSAVSGNGAGNTASVQATTTDITAPVESVISASTATTSATITWTTDELSSSIVDYGLTTSYATSTVESNTSPRVLSHSVTISNLASCVLYNYRVRSTDASSNTATSSNVTFITSGCVGTPSSEDDTSVAITNSSGGSLNLSSGGTGIQLTVPSNATAGNVTYQIKSLDASQVFAVAGTPSGMNPAGNHTFDLKALTAIASTTTSFNQQIAVTFTYSDFDVSGIDEQSLKIYRWNGSVWSELNSCSVNTSLNTITCYTSNFSVFSLFGEPGASVSQNQGTSLQSGTRRRIICTNGTNTCTSPSVISKLTFSKNLKLGMTDGEVQLLQKKLNSLGYIIATSGPGSLGNETSKFGFATQAALIKYQKNNNISPALGYFGPLTQATIMGNATTSQPVRHLMSGMSGADVQSLQKFLISHGYKLSSGPTGYFGNQTKAALTQYQSSRGITTEQGYLNDATIELMKKEF